jgi:hypothetical protein
MAKICETCKQPYPDSLASCPNCDAANLFKSLSGVQPPATDPEGAKATQLAATGKPTQMASISPGTPTQLAPPDVGALEIPPEQPAQPPVPLPGAARPAAASMLEGDEGAAEPAPSLLGGEGKKTMLAKTSQPTMLAKTGPKSTVLAPPGESQPMELAPDPSSPKGTMMARGGAQPTMLAKTPGQTQLAPADQGAMPFPAGDEKKTMLAGGAKPTQLAPAAGQTQLAPADQGALPFPAGDEKKTMLSPRQGATVLAPPEDAGPMDLPQEGGPKKTMLPPRQGATVLAAPEDAGPLPFPESEAKKTMLAPVKGSTILAPEDELAAEVGGDVSETQPLPVEGEGADLGARGPGGIDESSTQYETAADLMKKPAVQPKYGKRMLAGGLVGLVAGAAACFGLFYFDLVPASLLNAVGLTRLPSSADASAIDQARLFLNNGDFQKAIDTIGTSDDPAAKAVRGEARFLLYWQNRQKDPNYDDGAVQDSVKDLTESGGNDWRAVYFLGFIQEKCKKADEARKTYQEGLKKFAAQKAVFEGALARLEMTAPAGKAGAALWRDDDPRAQMANLALLLAAFQADQGAIDPNEAGFKFWQAAGAAKKQDYKAAVDALKEAVKQHEARRFKNMRKPQNPTSDPTEEIFLNAARDLELYWNMRDALKSADPKFAEGDPVQAIKNLVASSKEPDKQMKELLEKAVDKGLLPKDSKPGDLLDLIDKAEANQKIVDAAKKELEGAKYVDENQKDIVKGLKEALKDAENKKVVAAINKQLKDAGIDEEGEKGVGLVITERDNLNKLIDKAIEAFIEEGYLPPGSKRDKDGKVFLKGLEIAIEAGKSPLVNALRRTVGHLGYLGNDATIGGMIRSELAARTLAAEEKAAQYAILNAQARTPLDMLDFWLPLLERRENKEVQAGAALDAKRVLDLKTLAALDRARARCVQGLVLRNEGKFDEAREALTDALKVKAAAKEGFWRKYAVHAQRQLTDPTYYYLPQGEKLIAAGDYDEAVSVLNQGAGAFPSDGRMLALRSVALLDQAISKADKRVTSKDLEKARGDAQAAIKAGAAADGNYAAGRIAEELGRGEEAERHYRAALAARPDSKYRVALGRVLLQMQPPRPAKNGDKLPVPNKVGEAKPALNPLVAAVLLTTALAAAEDDIDVNKDVEAALKLAEQAIAAGDPEGYLIKGFALARKGDWTRGLQNYTEGLRRIIKPEYAEGLFYLVDRHPAFSLPDALRVPDPIQGEKHYAAGLKFYFAGQYPQAEEEFAKAYYNNSQDARYLYFLGLAKLSQPGKRDQAIDSFQRGWLLERQAKPGSAAVGAALERVQGQARQFLNAYRQ